MDVCEVARPAGFEPATFGSGGQRAHVRTSRNRSSRTSWRDGKRRLDHRRPGGQSAYRVSYAPQHSPQKLNQIPQSSAEGGREYRRSRDHFQCARRSLARGTLRLLLHRSDCEVTGRALPQMHVTWIVHPTLATRERCKRRLGRATGSRWIRIRLAEELIDFVREDEVCVRPSVGGCRVSWSHRRQSTATCAMSSVPLSRPC